MFKLFIGIASLLPCLTFASSLNKDLKIKEVKAWVKNHGREHTCVDEYLIRRKQLGWRMGLAPLSIAGGAVAGAVAGGITGHTGYLISGGPSDAWADLAYTLGGVTFGTISGTAIGLTSATISTINFFKNQQLLKLIVESRTTSGETSEKLLKQYTKLFPKDDLTIQELSDQVSDLDSSEKLCDGSIVAKKRLKKGRKLKQRLATNKEIFEFIHKNIASIGSEINEQ